MLSAIGYSSSGGLTVLRADIGVYDRSGQLAVVAEITNRLGTSCDWAAATRRNILAHNGLCRAEYFLLITPDRLYLWKNAGAEPNRVPPTLEAEMQSEFARYFAGAGIDPRQVSGHAFELLVAAWLSDVIRLKGEAEELAENRSWLAESGFFVAVKEGRIEYEVPM